MLKIRLARVGKKKRPAYRFIVSEAAKDPYGKALEILGHYNPFSKVCEINKERSLYWISKGAQLSPTVHNMFVDQNVIQADKIRASKSKKKNKGEEKPAAPAAEKSVEAPVATEAPAPVEEKKETEVKEEKSEKYKNKIKARSGK